MKVEKKLSETFKKIHQIIKMVIKYISGDERYGLMDALFENYDEPKRIKSEIILFQFAVSSVLTLVSYLV